MMFAWEPNVNLLTLVSRLDGASPHNVWWRVFARAVIVGMPVAIARNGRHGCEMVLE